MSLCFFGREHFIKGCTSIAACSSIRIGVERTVIVNADSFEELEQKIRDNTLNQLMREVVQCIYVERWE